MTEELELKDREILDLRNDILRETDILREQRRNQALQELELELEKAKLIQVNVLS